MSNIRARFMRSKVTRWREGVYNPNNVYQKSFTGIPVTFKCAYINGGSLQRDRDGAEFAPQSTYYMKVADIKIGDKVMFGLSSSQTVADGAEVVRKIVTKTTLTGSADMTVYTG